MVWKMTLQQMQMLVDLFHQPQPPRHQMNDPDPSTRNPLMTIIQLIANVHAF
jgi:hypothetical protein